MPFSNGKQKVVLVFRSIAALSGFKNECTCDDFYVDRDALTIVGSFTEEQLQIANFKYFATWEVESA